MRDAVSPATLFDAAVRPGRARLLDDLRLVVVARPGMTPPAAAPPGLVAVRRAFGEGRLAVVEDGWGGLRGLRLTGSDGIMSSDVVRRIRRSTLDSGLTEAA